MARRAQLIFLGTGGGRFATIYQTRSTGGLYYRGDVNLHIDPGPTALSQLKRYNLDPTRTNAILVSHCHPDHYNDAEILMEGMTEGTTVKRGTLVASKSVLEGTDEIGPAISEYHKRVVQEVIKAEPEGECEIKGMKVTFTPSKHTDPTTVGFKLTNDWGTISYIADTDLTQAVVDAHRGSRLLIMASTRPLYGKIPFHLSTEDSAHIIGEIEPELAILTHFGLKVLREKPKMQSDWITKKTGIKTFAAYDGMRVELGDTPRVLGRSNPRSKRLNNKKRI